jgi:hypothetical protein
VTYAGNLPEDLKQNFEEAVQKIPPTVLNALKKAGEKFVYTDRLIDHLPELAGVRPTGWTAGMTWENSEGLHITSTKEIVVARRAKDYSSGVYTVSDRQHASLYHETGHALSLSIGQKPGERFTESQSWIHAYQKDVASLPDRLKPALGYFLQSGWRGSEEVFAELFANQLGESSMTHPIGKFFPASAKLLESTIKGLK